jgi:predicted ATPase
MIVVGISGAQGGGKTSMLASIKDRGWQVDDFRVSRAVQAQLGWSVLTNVMETYETMVAFQNEVLRQKYEHDLTLHREPGARTIDAKGHVVLVERTFADIAAYTQLWTWKFIDRGDVTFTDGMRFLADYSRRCFEAHNRIYDAVVLLPYMSHIPWQNDPNRASREDIASVYESIEMFTKYRIKSSKSYTISQLTVEDRATEVINFLETLS